MEFFLFFQFFPLKLVYFWTKSRKNVYGCFFHSFCATDLNLGTKNNGTMKQSTLKTLIFASYGGSVPSQHYRYQKKNILQRLLFFVKMKLVSTVKWHNPNLVIDSLSTFYRKSCVCLKRKWNEPRIKTKIITFVWNLAFYLHGNEATLSWL